MISSIGKNPVSRSILIVSPFLLRLLCVWVCSVLLGFATPPLNRFFFLSRLDSSPFDGDALLRAFSAATLAREESKDREDVIDDFLVCFARPGKLREEPPLRASRPIPLAGKEDSDSPLCRTRGPGGAVTERTIPTRSLMEAEASDEMDEEPESLLASDSIPALSA